MYHRTIKRALALLMILILPIIANSSIGKTIVKLTSHQEMALFGLVKDYTMIGMGITYHDPAKYIEERVAAFENILSKLKATKANLMTAKEWQQINTQWSEVKKIITKTSTKPNAEALYEVVKTLEKPFEEMAERQAEIDNDDHERIYVLTGELGMESQRLAALYMMLVWEDTDKAQLKDKIMAAEAHATKNFNKLDHIKDDDVRANELKSKLKKDLMLIERLIDSGKYYPVLIAKSAEKISHEVEELLLVEEKKIE